MSADDLRRQIAERVIAHFEETARDRPWAAPGRVPLSVPLYGAEETMAALDCLLSQRVTMGAKVATFEREFAEAVGAKHAIMCNSGSSANLLIMTATTHPALGSSDLPAPLTAGDEIIVPAVTWATTVWPILQLGCVPVFVDVDLDTLNMDPAQVRRAVGARTRAIAPTHLLGNPVEMDPIMELARERGLWLLEDSCESLGSTYGGRKTGTLGHMGSFSFYFSHHITTIEGGMVVTDSDELADLCRSMRAHGWVRDISTRERFQKLYPEIDGRFLFAHLGYNLRPTDLQGAIGSVQLRRLDGFNQERQRNAAILTAALRKYHDWVHPAAATSKSVHTWFGFPMIITEKAPFTRSEMIAHLEAAGIETRPIIAGNITRQPALQGSRYRTVGMLPNATVVHERGLFIGNNPGLTEPVLDFIVATLTGFLERHGGRG